MLSVVGLFVIGLGMIGLSLYLARLEVLYYQREHEKSGAQEK
jgi:hypothetical protein